MEINQRNKDGTPEGYWKTYYLSGQLHYKGSYKNGIRIGYWENYFHSGFLCYKGTYINGKRIGYWVSKESYNTKDKFYVN